MNLAWPEAPGVASIALAITIFHTAKAWFSHRERMAKIQKRHGLRPTFAKGCSRVKVLAHRALSMIQDRQLSQRSFFRGSLIVRDRRRAMFIEGAGEPDFVIGVT
jgi:hypothetical protein